MIEHHPLDDFDLADFFDCVQRHGMAGAFALKQPELPAPKEDRIFASTHRNFQAKIMEDFFADKSFQSMTQIARQFREQFEATKHEVVAYSLDDSERRLYKETTIETLAEVAKQKLKEAIVKSGQATQGSGDDLKHRRDADTWTLIAQIVDIAVTLDL